MSDLTVACEVGDRTLDSASPVSTGPTTVRDHRRPCAPREDDRLTRDVKLYGALLATELADGGVDDAIMRGNGQMTKKGQLSATEKCKLTDWFPSSDWGDWGDEDWAPTDKYIPENCKQPVFSGFCNLMLADSARHNGRTALYVKDLLTQPTGLAEIASFLPLLKFKAEGRLPLARRIVIVIVTDQGNLNRACEKFGYKEREKNENAIGVNYFDGQDYDERAKWKVWLLGI